MQRTTELTKFEIGYLAGLVDGEGYIFVHHTKISDRTAPDLRIYCTSKPIIEMASHIMDSNPFPRRDHGKLVGWIAAVQGEKAIATLRRIVPHLKDASKRCRGLTILATFNAQPSIIGRHPSSEVFSHCPPPARLRTRYAGASRSTIELQDDGTANPSSSQNSLTLQALTSENPIKMSDFQKGWLCGIIDGEGYIHIRYRSDRDAMYPRVRVFVKSRPIIDSVARLMGVNPYARRSHGKDLGWYASVSHLKALTLLGLIVPALSDPSKKCRARKILDAFGNVGTIHSRMESDEFFGGCPPPTRTREARRVINVKQSAPGQRGGEARYIPAGS